MKELIRFALFDPGTVTYFSGLYGAPSSASPLDAIRRSFHDRHTEKETECDARRLFT